ncbi:asparagine synthetase [glutamine-hydrolyzing] 3 [Clostridia bacterium]|nr:asparagine synthetase [glutamine-hydrolyzing] 3 [Clostridia bacterium]
MCGIAGFCSHEEDFLHNHKENLYVLRNMSGTLHRRGPDENGTFLAKHCALGHTRLSIIDISSGKQPMTRQICGKTFVIIYNGEIYNMLDLREELISAGASFETNSDTEVILNGFLQYGADIVNKLNGIFAFAVWDSENLYLFRDRLGIKPLFYTIQGKRILFASEIKALLKHPNVAPKIDSGGLCEIFGISPARTDGNGVFKDIHEIKAGHFGVYGQNGLSLTKYWDAQTREHTDTYEQTIEKTRFLVTDAIKRQMISDVPICSFLSGGVDSSIVTAVCANELAKQGKRVSTFSFDFEGNDVFFKASGFQPDQDAAWADKMAEYANSDHTRLVCKTEDMYDALYTSVKAKDLPGMADVDSSLLHFCKQVKKHNKVVLTGECADEIFGGYPWFHSKKAFETNAFPWSADMGIRKKLLSADLLKKINLDEYARTRYDELVNAVPAISGEPWEETRRRQISYLNIKQFMRTLTDRLDRASMYNGLEARVPFADHRIVEYVYNVPWDIKCRGKEVKHLLRHSAAGLLPDEILFRKKSPYPKSYNPEYEKLLRIGVGELDKNHPINALVDTQKLREFAEAPRDGDAPWFGQLMGAAQMTAYILQVAFWLKEYKVEIV